MRFRWGCTVRAQLREEAQQYLSVPTKRGLSCPFEILDRCHLRPLEAMSASDSRETDGRISQGYRILHR